jgi:hypothetical protein
MAGHAQCPYILPPKPFGPATLSEVPSRKGFTSINEESIRLKSLHEGLSESSLNVRIIAVGTNPTVADGSRTTLFENGGNTLKTENESLGVEGDGRTHPTQQRSDKFLTLRDFCLRISYDG